MKTLVHAALLLLFSVGFMVLESVPAEAQIRMGAAAGLNFTSMGDLTGSANGSVANTAYDRRSGWHVGIFVDMAAGFVALRPGLYYMVVGPLFEGGVPLGGSSGGMQPPPSSSAEPDDFDLVYLTIPVDLRLRFNLPVVKPYVFAGPEFRLLQDAEIGTGFRDNLKSFSYAGNVGFGAEVGLLGLRLMPELRYAFDISGITGEEIDFRGVTFVADEEHKTRAVMLRVGILF